MAMNARLLRPLASGFKYASLRQGLVAYWPLNETATSGDVTAKDESGNGYDLTSNNSVLSSAGKIGNARDFVSSNSEFLSIASNSDMQFGNKDWTISLWFNADNWDAFQVVSKDSEAGREFECGLTTSGGFNRLLAVFYTNSGSPNSFTHGLAFLPSSSNSLDVGVWHWLAFRHVNSTGVITGRVNGFATTITRPAGQTWNETNTQFRLGARAYIGFFGYFNGLIDECARWNRALSDAELDQLYNSGNGINLGQRA